MKLIILIILIIFVIVTSYILYSNKFQKIKGGSLVNFYGYCYRITSLIVNYKCYFTEFDEINDRNSINITIVKTGIVTGSNATRRDGEFITHQTNIERELLRTFKSFYNLNFYRLQTNFTSPSNNLFINDLMNNPNIDRNLTDDQIYDLAERKCYFIYQTSEVYVHDWQYKNAKNYDCAFNCGDNSLCECILYYLNTNEQIFKSNHLTNNELYVFINNFEKAFEFYKMTSNKMNEYFTLLMKSDAWLDHI